jgi:hypothetical protein
MGTKKKNEDSRYIQQKYAQFADSEKERRRTIETERRLSAQDDIMWDNNEESASLRGGSRPTIFKDKSEKSKR